MFQSYFLLHLFKTTEKPLKKNEISSFVKKIDRASESAQVQTVHFIFHFERNTQTEQRQQKTDENYIKRMLISLEFGFLIISIYFFHFLSQFKLF